MKNEVLTLAELFNIPLDPELEFYESYINNIKNGITFVVVLEKNDNDYFMIGDILKKYFNFYEEKDLRFIKIRNSYKIPIFLDEINIIKLTLGNYVVYDGVYHKQLCHYDIQDLIVNSNLNPFREMFLKIELKIENFNNLRKQAELLNYISETEKYIRVLFDKTITGKNTLYFPTYGLNNIKKEREKLWGQTIDWTQQENIPFSLFNINNVLEYQEFLELFFDCKHNDILYVKAKRASKRRHQLLMDYSKILIMKQPLFLQNYSPTTINSKIKMNIIILKIIFLQWFFNS